MHCHGYIYRETLYFIVYSFWKIMQIRLHNLIRLHWLILLLIHNYIPIFPQKQFLFIHLFPVLKECSIIFIQYICVFIEAPLRYTAKVNRRLKCRQWTVNKIIIKKTLPQIKSMYRYNSKIIYTMQVLLKCTGPGSSHQPKLGTMWFWQKLCKALMLGHPWHQRYKCGITGQNMSYSLTWKQS